MTHRLAVLVAVHNRRAKTVACVQALRLAAERLPGCDWRVFLVDDGSTDGTTDAVRGLLGDRLEVQRGDGSLFWAASMAAAESVAVAWGPDFLLWLNDDVELEPDALLRLFAERASLPDASVICGPVRDRATGVVTYAGYRRPYRNPMNLIDVEPTGVVERVDSFTGNVILVSRRAAEMVGPIDGSFAHAYADVDYGLRATAAGVVVAMASDTVGHCEANLTGALSRIYDPRVPLRARWKAAMSRSGIPWWSQAHLYRRHGGALWPFLYVASYVRVLRPPRVAEDRRPARTPEKVPRS